MLITDMQQTNTKSLTDSS